MGGGREKTLTVQNNTFSADVRPQRKGLSDKPSTLQNIEEKGMEN